MSVQVGSSNAITRWRVGGKHPKYPGGKEAVDCKDVTTDDAN